MSKTDFSNLYEELKSNAGKTNSLQLQVPIDGSLEILACGDIGLMAWRAVKHQFVQSQIIHQSKPESE